MLGLRVNNSDERRVIQAIQRKPGISTKELSLITHKFSSRISDAKKKGHLIDKERDEKNGRYFYHYFYIGQREFGDD